MFCKTVVFSISGESREVTCSYSKMLQHLFFSPFHGGWLRYYTKTDYMRASGIIDTFHIFRVLKVARIFDESLKYDVNGVK